MTKTLKQINFLSPFMTVRTLFFITYLALFTTTIASCSGNTLDKEKEYEISVDCGTSKLEDLLPTRHDFTVTVRANDEWNYSIINSTDESSWIHFPISGKTEGTREIIISIEKNDKTTDRSATVRFSCGDKYADIRVSQLSANVIMIFDYGFEFPAAGGDCEFEVFSAIPYEYVINDDWIIEKEKKSWSNNKVQFTVLENNTIQKREGSVTFKNAISEASVHFSQRENVPQLSIAQGTYNIDANGGIINIEVYTNLSLTVTIEDGCSWVQQASTKSLPPTTFLFSVDKNETGETRKADIYFENQDGGMGLRAVIHQSN